MTTSNTHTLPPIWIVRFRRMNAKYIYFATTERKKQETIVIEYIFDFQIS